VDKYTSYGRTDEGKLLIQDFPAWEHAIQEFHRADVTVTVRRLSARRSEKQNRFYFGKLIRPIAQHTGSDPQQIHQAMKFRFLPQHVALEEGNGELLEGLVYGGTTTTLSPKEFADYCDRIRLWALEFLDLDLEPVEQQQE
jgi:hypothetical protein